MTALPNSVKSRFHFSWILHLENMDIFYESALPPEMFSFGTKREPERTAVPAGHESPSGAFKPQTGLQSKCRVFSAARSQRFRRAGPDGLRHPASTSCLERHSCPADRCPNSSSLYPPQAAVVAVALFSRFSDLKAPQPLRRQLPAGERVRPLRLLPLVASTSPFGRAGAKRLRGFVPPQGASGSRYRSPLRPFP